MPPVHRSQITCHKCGKLGHFAALPIHRIFRKARLRSGPPKYEQPGNQKQRKNYLDKQEMT